MHGYSIRPRNCHIMNKIIDFFKNPARRFNLLMLIAFALMTFFVLSNHEIWRDEAYVWVLCRDCGFFDLWKHVAVEGHPPLWYLLVLPLAKSGLNVFSMQVLAWFFAVLGAAFFVFKSPFNGFLKFTFLFSYDMFYWHSVIARSYSLFPILVFLLAYLYPKKKEHPYLFISVLILLANVHVILFGFCAGLLGVFLWDEIIKNNGSFRKKLPYLGAFCVAFIDFLLMGIVILIGKTYNICIADAFISPSILELFQKWMGGINGMPYCAPILIIFLLWFAFVLFKENKKLLFIFSAAFIYQFIIYKFVWGFLPQRAFSIFWVILFCLWILLEKKSKIFEYTQLFIATIFLSSFLVGTKYVTQDLLYDYSGSKSTAIYIKEKLPQKALIVTDDTENKAGIFAYLPGVKFWSLMRNEFYTVESWDFKRADKNKINLPNYFLNFDVYLVSTKLAKPSFDNELKCMPFYQNKNKVIDENEDFIICKLTKNPKNKADKTDGK